MSEGKREIQIPAEIFEQIQQRVTGTEFSSVEEYVTFVLEEVLKDEDEDESETPFTAEDEEEVKKRLRALGYLD